MARPSTEGLLKEIQSDNLENVYCHVTNKAIEWIVAGFIIEGNELLENLWRYGIEHSRDLWLQDEGLQIMWEISGLAPLKIPFQFKGLEEIENENWSRFYPSWSHT